MPNGILDQLTGQGALQEALPPTGMPGPLPEMTPAPAPAEAGGGGFFGALDRGMGAAAQSIDQFSLPVIASMVAMQGGPQALGALMAGITEGRARRESLNIQQRGLDIREQELGFRGEELEARQEERATAQTTREDEAKRKWRDSILRQANEIADNIGQQLQDASLSEYADIVQGGDNYILNLRKLDPELAQILPPGYISDLYPIGPKQREEAGQRELVLQNFFENDESLPAKEAYARGDQEEAIRILSMRRFQQLNPNDPPSVLELMEATGAYGYNEDELGNVTFAFPEVEQERASWGTGETLVGPGGKRVPSRIRAETGEVEPLQLPEGFSIPEPRGLNIQLDPGVSIREIGPEGETIERRVPKGSPELFEPRVVKPPEKEEPRSFKDLIELRLKARRFGLEALTDEERRLVDELGLLEQR